MSKGEEIVEEIVKDRKAVRRLAEAIVSDADVRLAVVNAILRDVATKEDVEKLRAETKADIDRLREGDRREVQGDRREVQGDRREVQGDRREVRLHKGGAELARGQSLEARGTGGTHGGHERGRPRGGNRHSAEAYLLKRGSRLSEWGNVDRVVNSVSSSLGEAQPGERAPP